MAFDRQPRSKRKQWLEYSVGAAALALFVIPAWMVRIPVEHPVVAVLFEYRTGATADDVMSMKGLAIEVTRRLAQVNGLAVRAAVPSPIGPDTVVTLGQRRGATHVVAGSFFNAAGALHHVDVTIVRVRDGTALWYGSFPIENDGVLPIREPIGRAATRVLGLVWQGRSEHSTAPPLQRLFLKARALQAAPADAGRREAIEILERIAQEDPSFVPARAALAITLARPTPGNPEPPAIGEDVAHAVRAAFEQDPQLAEASAAMGLLSASTCEWPHAETYFRGALRLDPSATSASTAFVLSTLLPLQRTGEARDLLRTALEVDPASADLRRTLAFIELESGDYEQALRTSRESSGGGSEPADPSVGRALYLSGRTAEAFDFFREADHYWGFRGYAMAVSGRHDAARELADAHPREPARQMLIYAGLNDPERTFDALWRTALSNPRRALIWMQRAEIEPVLRADARAVALRERLRRPASAGGCRLSGGVSASRTVSPFTA